MKGKRERNLLNAVKRKKYPAKFLLSSNEIFSSDSPSLVFGWKLVNGKYKFAWLEAYWSHSFSALTNKYENHEGGYLFTLFYVISWLQLHKFSVESNIFFNLVKKISYDCKGSITEYDICFADDELLLWYVWPTKGV